MYHWKPPNSFNAVERAFFKFLGGKDRYSYQGPRFGILEIACKHLKWWEDILTSLKMSNVDVWNKPREDGQRKYVVFVDKLYVARDHTASMLARVVSCSFLFPSFDIWRNASTP